MQKAECSNVRYAVVQFAYRETYRDSNKRDPQEFMNGRTVVSRLAGRCLLKLRAIDTGRISDNTKTTRPRGGKRARCTNEMKRGRIFFLSLPAPSITAARHHHRSSPTRRLRRAWTYTADGARANLTHFRRTKTVPRAYFHVFFLPQPNQRPAVTQTRHHPSRAFHFVLTVRTFAALSSPFSSLALYLCAPSVPAFLFASVYFTHYFNCLLFLCVHLFFLVTSTPSFPPFTCSLTLTITRLCAFRSLANNAAAALVPTRCVFSLNKFNLNFPAVRNVY